jgi:HK97 gp10 family phage protein
VAKGIRLQVNGLKELKKKFGEIPRLVAEEVDGAMQVAALDFEDRAALAAPVNTGRLKGGIKAEFIKEMDWQVTSYVEYSAYVEFGTRSSVFIPKGLENYAKQFQTSDGTGVGMRAQPFFFIQRGPVFKELIKDCKEAIKRAMK